MTSGSWLAEKRDNILTLSHFSTLPHLCEVWNLVRSEKLWISWPGLDMAPIFAFVFLRKSCCESFYGLRLTFPSLTPYFLCLFRQFSALCIPQGRMTASLTLTKCAIGRIVNLTHHYSPGNVTRVERLQVTLDHPETTLLGQVIT